MTHFRELNPEIPHLLKFAFSPEKNALNVSTRFLTFNKLLRKKLKSSAKVVFKNHY